MDLATVTSYRVAHTRADLTLAPGEVVLGGGTWLFSEPNRTVAGLLDLAGLSWEPWERLDGTGDGAAAVRIAATCTIEQVCAVPWDDWAPDAGLARLVHQCSDALLMSFKVKGSATVGGNIALALPAGAMTSLFAGLDATALVWAPGGGERREPVAELVRGDGVTSLRPGEVIRTVEVPAAALAARTAFRRISLTPHGRSAAVVVGRVEVAGSQVEGASGPRHGTWPSGDVVVTVTAATTRPVPLRLGPVERGLDALASVLDDALAKVDCWFADPHGAADWRAAVTGVLAHEVLTELLT